MLDVLSKVCGALGMPRRETFRLRYFVAACTGLIFLLPANGQGLVTFNCPNAWGFNGSAIAAGRTIWFSSVVRVGGLGSQPATVSFASSTIQFTAKGIAYNVNVPSAAIIFSPTAASASTTFDSANNRWTTTVPAVAAQSSGLHVFLTGIAFSVPSGGFPGGIGPVTWNGAFATDTPGLTAQWRWGAAVYTSFGSDFNALGVQSTDNDKPDFAGTPQAFKAFVTEGGTGQSWSKYTGDYSNGLFCRTPLDGTGTFIPFGPATYSGASGPAISTTNTFTILDPTATYVLQISNKHVTNSRVTLNGTELLDPGAFANSDEFITKPVVLSANNQLVVQLGTTVGTSMTLEMVGIDHTPPVVSAAASPLPNQAGWNNTSVTVAFTCSDKTSGIASCPPPITVTAEGANQVVRGTATDKAGNSATASATINIDKTPPTISGVASPAPNAAGWNNSNVTVTFICSDALSGVGFCAPPVGVTTEAKNQVVTGTVVDKAGNSTRASVTVSLDKTPPNVTIASPPNGSTIALSTTSIGVSGTDGDALSGIAGVMCNGAPATISGSNFTCTVPLTAGSNSIPIQATDIAGNTKAASLTLTYAPAPQIAISAPANLSVTNLSPVTVNGTVSDPNATVTINGIPAPQSSGMFSMPVPLVEGLNVLAAVAKNASGVTSTASVQVTLDTTPPHITIDSPADGTTTTDASVTVTGIANDVVVGTVNAQDVQVTVNGIAAQVANRTYAAASVPLSIGKNTIQAKGVDRAGNGTTTSVNITRALPSQPPPPAIGQAVIIESLSTISGNNQTGTIGMQLGAPLVVALVDSSNHPVPNQAIVFKVTGNNGIVSTGGPGAAAVAATTGANGQAQVFWTLGQRSGAGSNTVQVSTTLAIGPVNFTATGLTSNASLIIADSGNGQTGVIGQPLSFPFVAAVTDSGHNRVSGVPVTFTAKLGGGNFGGLASQTVTSDSNGRAIAVLTLGLQEGIENNVIEATFSGNTGLPVAFAASAKAPGNPANTTISGVVLDNSNNPIQAATVRIFQTNQGNNNNLPIQIGTPVLTNAQGAFLIPSAPVGFFKLMADGSTAAGPKHYPTLEYDIATIAGNDNTVGMPIYLPALDTVNKLCVDATHGGTLKLPQVPGFSLTVAAGSATFPGGSKTGCVSVTPVNGDKVPMAPGFGQQPRFIVTIQPVGTTFNPPAPITIPNADGLKPRAVTEMYSYDHDLSMFIAIGTGTVSNDGSVIASNPGVGVLKAGWHCGGDPNTAGTVADCPICKICDGVACVADPSQDGSPIPNNQCVVCENGASAPIPLNPTQVQKQITFGLPTPTLSAITDGINKFGHLFGIDLSTNLLQIQGTTTTQQCCDPTNGLGSNTDGNVAGNFGGFTLKGKIWPPGPIPDVNESTSFGGVTLGFKAKFLGGLFVNIGASVTGQVGYRQSDCTTVAADKAGCFYGGLNTTFTPGFDVEITGSAEVDIGNTMFMGSVSTVLGSFSWPINLSSVGYNATNCSEGLSGGLFTAPKGSASVSASFSIGVVIAGNSLTFQKTWNFLSCDIFATSLPSCTVNVF